MLSSGVAAAGEHPSSGEGSCLSSLTHHLGRNEEVAVWTGGVDPVVGRVADIDRDRLRLVLSVYDPKVSRFLREEIAITEIERFEYREGPGYLIPAGALIGLALALSEGGTGDYFAFTILSGFAGAGLGWLATALLTHTRQITCEPSATP